MDKQNLELIHSVPTWLQENKLKDDWWISHDGIRQKPSMPINLGMMCAHRLPGKVKARHASAKKINGELWIDLSEELRKYWDPKFKGPPHECPYCGTSLRGTMIEPEAPSSTDTLLAAGSLIPAVGLLFGLASASSRPQAKKILGCPGCGAGFPLTRGE